MAKKKFENKFSDNRKRKRKYSVEGAQDMTIEELIESIRGKIQHVQQTDARKNHL